MHSTTSRRVGASLFAFLSTPVIRTSERRIRLRIPHYQPVRSISTTQRHFQQSPAPAHNLTPSSEPSPLNTLENASASANTSTIAPATERSLTDSLADPPPLLDESERQVDWTRSYHGISSTPFTTEQAAILQQDINADDIEIKPDGIIYLPEIKYRRILNRAFGPGGWGLVPRGETIVTGKLVTREYGLVCNNRLVSIARGEQQYFDPDGIPTATEGCKSNALMRCCKDLGIASELWDPRFIKRFMAERSREVIVEHATTKKRRKHYMRKDDDVRWPLKIVQDNTAGARK